MSERLSDGELLDVLAAFMESTGTDSNDSKRLGALVAWVCQDPERATAALNFFGPAVARG